MDITASPGAVGISTKVLKNCATELGPVLTDLFNFCLDKGEIPDEWKIAYVTPLYKGKGSKSDISNYRPISILPPIAKTFESVLAKRIRHHLEANNILSDSQFGFRPKRSCELALNTMIDDWRENLENGNEVVSVFLDLSKAFDTVDHTLLINKLERYNFSIKSILLIKNYLSNRSVRVCVNGCLSEKKPLNVGVPQGSILGPLLFIIYINDLCYLPLVSRLVLFADDTTIFLFGKNLAESLAILENELKLISEWLAKNRLLLNISKTQAMHLSNSKNVDSLTYTIDLNNQKINFVTQCKILGVIIDNKLKFSAQISETCKKVNKKTFLLSKSLFLFSDNFKHILFKLFIQTYFDYCSTLYIYLSTKFDRDRLEVTFYKSINRILEVNLLRSTEEERFEKLKKYKILPISYRKFYYFSNFIYKLLLNGKTKLFYKLCEFKKQSCENIQTRHLYTQPIFKTNYYKYSFIKISTEFLNRFLSSYIKSCTNNKEKHKNMSLIKHFTKNAKDLSAKLSSFIT